jgi:hypothetical protein
MQLPLSPPATPLGPITERPYSVPLKSEETLVPVAEDASTSFSLSKASSKSLTLSQRVQNMHEGNPAHHSPTGSENDLAASIKKSLKNRSNYSSFNDVSKRSKGLKKG